MDGSIGPDVGERAPEFGASLVCPDGNVTETRLGALVERGPVLLSFYAVGSGPAPIELSEWNSLRDFEWFASGEEVRVVGVSRLDAPAGRRLVERESLGYPLVIDRDSAIARRYGVEYRNLGAVTRGRPTAVRSCLLVDRRRTVRYRWVGEHRPKPATPPLTEMHAAIRREFAAPTETFGLV